VCGEPAELPGSQLGYLQTLRPDALPLCLHSWRMKFRHPLSRELVKFTAPPPAWAELP
jgi:23S rRNA-/tRNA-specific pseudouridylate synthase